MNIDDELEKYGVWIKKGPMDSPREDTEPLDLIPVDNTSSDTIPDDILKDLLNKAYGIVLGSFSKKKQKEISGDE